MSIAFILTKLEPRHVELCAFSGADHSQVHAVVRALYAGIGRSYGHRRPAQKLTSRIHGIDIL